MKSGTRGGLMRKRYLRSLLLAIAMLFVSTAAFGQVSVSVTIAPPELPEYDQPLCPGDGYFWTPGYWAWDGEDYYWVPGTWVLAPEVGFFWTPPWWGWGGSAYIFHAGFWGPVVGFYGGIDYGYGYFGHGFVGGRWEGGHFFYNRAVWHVDEHVVHNVYEERVEVNRNIRVSYNGGRGGINERPTPEEQRAERERHLPPVADQTRHEEAARSNRELRASVNHGKPPVPATPRPAEFNTHGGASNREATRAETPAGHTNNPVHPKDLPAYQRPAAPNTGNTKLDQKYQKQQEDLARKQDQQRQKLQQQQDREHQQYTKQNANEARNQQLEQKHSQQTQQMQQHHVQQQQQLQQRQQPPHQTSAPKEKH
jgi:hypothetical protein